MNHSVSPSPLSSPVEGEESKGEEARKGLASDSLPVLDTVGAVSRSVVKSDEISGIRGFADRRR